MVKGRNLNLISFSVLGFLGVYISAFQRFLDEMAIDLSLTKVSMGVIVTAHFAGFFVGTLVSGEVSDKYGRRIVVLSSLSSFLAGLVFVLIASDLFLLIVGMFFIGVGFGTTESSITTLLTDVAPEKSNQIINISQVFFGIGAAIGPFIAMVFIFFLDKWKYFYCISIVFVVVFILLFWNYRYPDYSVNEKIDGIITVKLIKQKKFALLLLSIVMYVGIEEGVAFWITSYVKEWSTLDYFPSLVLAAFWGSMIIGRYLVSKFSKKLNEIIIVSSLISAVFLSVILLSQNNIVTIVCFFGLGLGISGIWPMLMALARMYYPNYSGTAFGIMMAGCAIGGAVIPLVMGYVGSLVGMRYALAFCFIPSTIIIMSHIFVKYDKSPDTHSIFKLSDQK